jgi:hypothetical protein
LLSSNDENVGDPLIAKNMIAKIYIEEFEYLVMYFVLLEVVILTIVIFLPSNTSEL